MTDEAAQRLAPSLAARVAGRLLGIRQPLRGHGLRRVPGLSFVDRMILRSASRGHLVRCRILGHRMTFPTADTGLAPYLLSDGIYEPVMTRAFQDAVARGAVVVDIGANFGYFTLLAAQRTGRLGHVIAFEPALSMRRLLLENLSMNSYDNVAVRKVALSNVSGTASLYMDRDNVGNPSLSRENIGALAETARVTTAMLDEWLATKEHVSHVDVVKIDVQGAEGLVVAGGVRTMAAASHVFIEFWPRGLRALNTDPGALLQRFVDWGFTAYLLKEGAGRIRYDDASALIRICDEANDPEAHVNIHMARS